ncbi:dephospho-CoA kinase [Gordonia sp. HNM0687]|uniref:Dephospho-CoA kinase n=1 Tax=Gordonia mangrovi TaxID=2665643 RepID=A0A6L7GNR7_9ACTN|nr:dephospho-CoA kinase [Gordonia mangrovi]MXP21252.1 dephospho-CoA kinase [Gordonia mangrovi]UVF78221.1 dephospho-CoA kinase [Gordonia mangrovi]
MIRLGLSGGIGAGKSTVAKTFIDRGGYHIDADKIAREVVEPGTPGLAALVEAFGEEILAEDGSLDRPALAAKAFVDDEQRQKLNSITHPLVGKRTQELLKAAPDDAIVIQDIPLLVEGNMAPFFHLVVIVHADAETRVQRLTTARGMPEDDARARIAAQADDDQRRAVADVWLDNSGSRDDLAAAAAALWDERLVPFERNVRSQTVVRAPLELAEPDPGWAAEGARLVNRLWAIVGDKASAIDHIGSTAVPGLIAKPTIDVQITVAELSVADALADALADGGFPRVAGVDGDNPKADPATGSVDEGSWGKRLHGSADPGRSANVHLRATDSPGRAFALDFRDWLRADAAARAEYAEVKRKALASADGDLGRYIEAKEPWFEGAYRRIAVWKSDGSHS